MPVTVEQRYHPFRPIDIALPQDNTGFCYILVSLKRQNRTYIGQTFRLLKRLKQHNSGWGSRQTASPTLRPWALLAFVCGFDGRRYCMEEFERQWEHKREIHMRRQRHLTAYQIADLARSVISEFSDGPLSFLDLRYVKTGTFQLSDSECDRTG